MKNTESDISSGIEVEKEVENEKITIFALR